MPVGDATHFSAGRSEGHGPDAAGNDGDSLRIRAERKVRAHAQLLIENASATARTANIGCTFAGQFKTIPNKSLMTSTSGDLLRILLH